VSPLPHSRGISGIYIIPQGRKKMKKNFTAIVLLALVASHILDGGPEKPPVITALKALIVLAGTILQTIVWRRGEA